MLPLIGTTSQECKDSERCRNIAIWQSMLIVCFLLVWGGYGKDSWEYLLGFDGRPLAYNKEWLFWITGYVLNKVVYDPWSLKIISAVGGLAMCYGIISFFRNYGWQYCVVGLFALLLVPAFYLLLGSAVRQGLAGAIIVIGIVNLYKGRYYVFAGSAFVALLLHRTSLIFAIAGGLSKFSIRSVPHVLLVVPILGLVAFWMGPLIGIDGTDYVPHAKKSEGDFHWTKFVMAYGLAFVGMYKVRHAIKPFGEIVAAYGYMVAISAFFVTYEVPFERLLGYSELLLPFVAAIVIDSVSWKQSRIVGLWFVGLAAGLLLWSHPSIVETLGYTTR